MRVEVRSERNIPHQVPGGERRTNTEYQVVLIGKGAEVVTSRFVTPGSFLDGFLSDTQARVRAREVADGLKAFFSNQGQLDTAEEPVGDARPRRSRTPGLVEQKSFAPLRA